MTKPSAKRAKTMAYSSGSGMMALWMVTWMPFNNVSKGSSTIVSSRKEVADGFAEDAGARPSGRIPGGIRQSAPGNPNPHIISIGIIIQEEVGNGSVATADGDGGRVGGVVGKRRPRAPNSRRSGFHRLDVASIGSGKQREKLKERIAGRVHDEHVSAIRGIGVDIIPRVLQKERVASACGSDVNAASRGGRAAKNPEGLVGVVVMAGEDVQIQLRLPLLHSNPRQRRGHQSRYKATI